MATKRLFILGAGAFGREVAVWARDVCRAQQEWELAGFLDDNPQALAGFASDLKVVGGINDYDLRPSDLAVIAIGEPRRRKEVAEKAAGRVQFATLIHPTAIIGPHCSIGAGCILCPGVILTTNVTLGDHVQLNLHATVGHDVRIGAFATLNSHADVTGCATVDEGAYLGSHAVVLPKARVGAFARVGAGSVVLRHVEPGETVIGVPAQRV